MTRWSVLIGRSKGLRHPSIMVVAWKMRSMLALFACLMLVVTAWSGIAQAAGPACCETADQVAVHVMGDCDEVPADADKNYPHCHAGCHGHHATAPIPARAFDKVVVTTRTYGPAAERTLAAHQADQTLRPPRA